MSDLRRVLTRIETDFDFYLAVHRDPRGALAPFELSSDEVEVFVHSGMPLWILVLEPDGGLPPPKPPFVVHYSIPIDFEPWHEYREADLTVLRGGPAVQTAVRAVHTADTQSARTAAVAQLIELI